MVKFEFGHVGINAQSEEEGKRMKDFFTDVMGYDNYREIPASYFTGDNKMELMKKMGKGTMGHLGFFVDDMPEAIAYLESKGYEMDYATARYAEDGKTIRLIFLKDEINGFRIHITVKTAPFYKEQEGFEPLPVR
ncbi:MAG: VOC family protein [Erysipelotrichaceae bacterium]|nr:VOC family protein [Erysipelotrichaceae bacterium]